MASESPEIVPDGSANRPAIGARRPASVDKRILGVVAFVFIAGAGYLLSRSITSTAPAPQTPVAASSLAVAVTAAETGVKQNASPENYLNLSLAYSRARRFQESLDAAKNAVRLRPNYAEAFNNEAAAYEDLHQWDDAIAAAREALRLKPDFTLARNNLVYAASQKAHGR
jgi:tetratricopeptide (TPR) repeat protein